MSDVILTEKQEVNALCLIDNMNKHFLACDTTKPGGGKSMEVIYIIKKLKIKNPIMVCPSFMVKTWERLDAKYNVGFIAILSYDILRGTSINESEDSSIVLNHGFLLRKGNNYEMTKSFKRLVLKEGCWLFFDEFQKLKNAQRMQRLAAKALCSGIFNLREEYANCPFSGCYFLSATPFDKKEHCINWCDTVGIISNLELISSDRTKESGLLQLKEYCKTINLEEVNAIWGTSSIKQKFALDIAFELCTKVLFPELFSFVEVDITKCNKQTIYYAYEKIPKIGMELLEVAECMIHCAALNITERLEKKYAQIIGSDEEDSDILSNRAGMTHGQITSQVVKTYYFICPNAIKALDEVPNCKVVIYLEYKEAIKVAARLLEDYGVIVLTGGPNSKKGERDKLIELFQDSSLEYRVLVVICQIGSVGLEFDDKKGNRPRISFMNLIHSTELTIQSAGRTDREDTKSKSLFFICKVDTDEDIEQSLDKTHKEKSNILKKTLRKNGVIPPISFAQIYDLRNQSFKKLLETAGDHVYEDNDEVEEVKEEVIEIKRSNIKVSNWFDE